jgi:hypothetical protein
MTCPDCAPNAARVIALEEEVKALRVAADTSPIGMHIRLIAGLFDVSPTEATKLHHSWRRGGLDLNTMATITHATPPSLLSAMVKQGFDT